MTQSLSNIVDITVEVTPATVSPNGMNIGLIVGPSTVIPASTRTAQYSGTQDMLNNGWTGTEPEYGAAVLYFEQTPTPSAVVIGCQAQNQTELTTALTSGTAYTSLSVEALVEAINSGSTITIGSGSTTQTVTATSTAAAGATTIDVNSFTANETYAVGTTVSAQESILEAVQACRAANSTWYGLYTTGAQDADVESVASYVDTVIPPAAYFYTTSDSAILVGTTPNVMSTLQENKIHKTVGQYSTTPHAAASIMGYAMGANNGLANSAYTLAYKSEPGVTPEVLTTTQYSNISGWNGNVYTNFGSQYNLFTQGVTADGTPFDQIINLDTLTAAIQTAVMNALTTGPKIPQTDAGVTMLVNAIAGPCQQALNAGVIAPGVWNGGTVLGLQNGSTLSNGYLVIADTIANQSPSDITARKSPPIYVCLLMAGAIEHVVIGVIVNQ